MGTGSLFHRAHDGRASASALYHRLTSPHRRLPSSPLECVRLACGRLRAPEGAVELRFQFEDYALDTDRRELRRGADLVSVAPQVFDLLGLPDPQSRARRQQGRSHRRRLGRAHRVRIGTDHPDQCGSARNRRQRRGAASNQDLAPQGHPLRGRRARGAKAGQRGARGSEPIDATVTSPCRTKPSIAVLPFTNMGGDPEQDYFADGMAEEIITALSRCTWLFVIARNSSFTYKGKRGRRASGRTRARRALRAGRKRPARGQSAALHRTADRGNDRRAHLGRSLRRRDGRRLRSAGSHHRKCRRRDRAKPAARRDRAAKAASRRPTSMPTTCCCARSSSSTNSPRRASPRRSSCLQQALAIDPAYAPAMALAAYCYANAVSRAGPRTRRRKPLGPALGHAGGRPRQGRRQRPVDGRLGDPGFREGPQPRTRAFPIFRCN